MILLSSNRFATTVKKKFWKGLRLPPAPRPERAGQARPGQTRPGRTDRTNGPNWTQAEAGTDQKSKLRHGNFTLKPKWANDKERKYNPQAGRHNTTHTDLQTENRDTQRNTEKRKQTET